MMDGVVVMDILCRTVLLNLMSAFFRVLEPGQSHTVNHMLGVLEEPNQRVIQDVLCRPNDPLEAFLS